MRSAMCKQLNKLTISCKNQLMVYLKSKNVILIFVKFFNNILVFNQNMPKYFCDKLSFINVTNTIFTVLHNYLGLGLDFVCRVFQNKRRTHRFISPRKLNRYNYYLKLWYKLGVFRHQPYIPSEFEQ